MRNTSFLTSLPGPLGYEIMTYRVYPQGIGTKVPGCDSIVRKFKLQSRLAQSPGAVEYTYCTSAKE